MHHQVVDFAGLPNLPKVNECYVALKTTLKLAGSQSAFKAIDLDAVVAVVLAAQAAGAKRFGVVSAMGADAKSPVFYNRIKGEMELALKQLGLKSLVIARPSLLNGNRAALGQPKRGVEGLGLWLARRLRPLLPVNYRAVLAKDVAHALIQAVQAVNPGIVTLLSGDMHDHR
ncbi:epimerase [Rhodoferax sp. U11-2br]|uniref:epimerase n=1 Tax=Rhodoferax sp. U11-2br TaxID=2838878 RepID=UPI001BEAF860|nr:epimerase [Rhodoferax sp. U11-2br]MBT3065241.1 epimerase [Rhodoferax sp. U11-2br]